MTQAERDRQLSKLRAASSRTVGRLLLTRVLRALADTLPVPLIYAAGALTWLKVMPSPTPLPRWSLIGLILTSLIPCIALVRVFTQRRPELWGAQTLDRHHDLAGRIANALAFAEKPGRSELMDAAIDDALVHTQQLSPRRAAPIKLPVGLLASVLLALCVVGISKLEMRTRYWVPAAAVSTFEPLDLPRDDVDLLRETSEELAAHAEDPETIAALRQFNALVEDIAARRLDREEVFKRLEELERNLVGQSTLATEGLDEGLEALSRELEKSTLSKPTAEALQAKNLPDAKRALEELAKKLKDQPKRISKKDLDRLRKALNDAAKQNAERAQRLDEQRAELAEQRKRLLDKKKQQSGSLSQKDLQQLQRTERQLKRLDRQKQRAGKGAEQMSKLDRELAEAARKLMEEMGDAAQHLDQGAQELNRMAKKQLSDQEKQALKKQLEELRQLLRQNKGDNSKRREMLEKFRQAARGQQGQSGQSGSKDGKRGKGGKPQLRLGMGQGQSVDIDVPSAGQQTPGAGSGGPNEGGSDPGHSPGSDPKGESSPQLQGNVQDVAAAGIDSGEGQASSEVVYGAAERGFSGGGYKKIYTDYKTVAEEVLQSDDIPPGYKFYVRRYFQLIRPRD